MRSLRMPRTAVSVSIRRARLRRILHLPTGQGRVRDSSGPDVKEVGDSPGLDACAGGERLLSGAVSRTLTKHLTIGGCIGTVRTGVVRSAALKSGNPDSQLGSTGDEQTSSALCYL